MLSDQRIRVHSSNQNICLPHCLLFVPLQARAGSIRAAAVSRSIAASRTADSSRRRSFRRQCKQH